MDDVGDAPHVRERRLGHRVEVDPPLVGSLDVEAPRVPRVELDSGHLHRPDDVRRMLDTQLIGSPIPPREVHPNRPNPFGRAVRDALLVDLLAGNARRKAVQHAGPVTQRAHDPVRHGEVVAHEVELGFATHREVHALRAADAHRAIANLHVDGGTGIGLRHRTIIAFPDHAGR